MPKVRPIAFYLPQFYPTPENDEWWGPGFTEWTNVKRARPLYPGHYQPRLPGDLGFYDLRDSEIREKQADMAREAGIEGFCYWHYWFSGRRLLNEVFDEVVATGKPDFPFCLCWANHSWYKKTWDYLQTDTLLIEQTYPGVDDYRNHFYTMLPAFRDKRYITVDGRLLFGIFAPENFPDCKLFFDTWNSLAKANGLKGFYFLGFNQGYDLYLKRISDSSYDCNVCDCLTNIFKTPKEDGYLLHYSKRLGRKLFGWPYTTNYDRYLSQMKFLMENNTSLVPCIVPDFDHSPRSGNRWIIMKGSTPEKWKDLCLAAKNAVETNQSSEGILFIKSWNEWGEGNYLEPDIKFGYSYLDALKSVLKGSK